jgi:hypothetical protein
VLDIPVPEIVLQGTSVMAIVGKLEAAGVPKHVWVDGKGQLSGLAKALDEMMKAYWTDRSATLANEHMGFRRVLAPEARKP